MDQKYLENLLNNFRDGKIDINRTMEELKSLPYKDLGFAKIDSHRALRRGFPEVIYCEGKTPDQVSQIVKEMVKTSSTILGMRADSEVFKSIKKVAKNAEYFKDARAVLIGEKPKISNTGLILVISAGTADIPVASEAALTAEVLGNNVKRIFDAGVAGIHRLLSHRETLVKANVIIVAAGMEGALPGIVGGLVSCPVIGVPTSIGYGTSFNGLSALLTMLNSCVPGIAVVNIDNGFGAGYLAHLINSGKQELSK